MKKTINHNQSGAISMLVLTVGVSLSIAVTGVALVAGIQYMSSVRTIAFERSLDIAQAGAEYYRWHLAHDPNDFTDATGHSGPYLHLINDPYGETEAVFSLNISPPASGSSTVTIESTGWLASNPEIKRTVKARYGIPSLARYSFLHNANVWFGSGITVHGQVMSNGGIRMDGVNDSTVESALEEYTCGSETGCSPPDDRDGVWGSGGPSALWQYPVPQTDFNSLQIDFNQLRTSAQTNGVYLPASGAFGYHLVFTDNGNVAVYTVTAANSIRGWSPDGGCENLRQNITGQTLVNTYSLSQKPIIFAEDHLWVDGIVNGQVTVVAARFPLAVNYMNIWINDNLTYISKDGHSQTGIFAQNNIYFRYNIPTNFEINGALLSANGRIIRHSYRYSGCSWLANAVRNNLTIYGSVISNQKSYWNYGTSPTSGFVTRSITYDTNLYFTPPPYFPSQGDYEFISWEEE